jgi:hypothetical protein
MPDKGDGAVVSFVEKAPAIKGSNRPLGGISTRRGRIGRLEACRRLDMDEGVPARNPGEFLVVPHKTIGSVRPADSPVVAEIATSSPPSNFALEGRVIAPSWLPFRTSRFGE